MSLSVMTEDMTLKELSDYCNKQDTCDSCKYNEDCRDGLGACPKYWFPNKEDELEKKIQQGLSEGRYVEKDGRIDVRRNPDAVYTVCQCHKCNEFFEADCELPHICKRVNSIVFKERKY